MLTRSGDTAAGTTPARAGRPPAGKVLADPAAAHGKSRAVLSLCSEPGGSCPTRTRQQPDRGGRHWRPGDRWVDR
ncbi:hypothetical protein SSAG_01169 [Streptomyces sp. Mg1]|nr:hypothetical protein SSAG_01169 [Streptomyces sp. Mg1]